MVRPGRILLGDNPFIGVDHLSQERSRQRVSHIDPTGIMRVIDAAVEAGAQGIVCSAHPAMKATLNVMKEQHRSGGFDVYLIVPDVQHYIRLASEGGMLGVLNETFGRLSYGGKTKAFVGGGVSLLTSNPERVMKTYLEAEVSSFAKLVPHESCLRGVFLHELVTELLVSFRLAAFAQTYINYVRNSLGILPGFVTRNFARFVDFASETGLPEDEMIVMSPFNKQGFQMNPSREACELALVAHPEVTVIAMSVLSAGYLDLKEAISYLTSLPRSVSCVVGVSTEAHASETFSYLREKLSQG